MVISSSNVSMNSARSYERNIKGQTRTTNWQVFNPSNMSQTTRNFSSSYKEDSFFNNYNDFAKNLKNVQGKQDENFSTKSPQANIISNVPASYNHAPIDSIHEMMSKTLISLLEMLYRSRGLTYPQENGYNYRNSSRNYELHHNSSQNPYAVVSGNVGTLWNRITEQHYSFYESESVTFASSGTAITADGRQLSFDVSFSMSREFQKEYYSSDFMQYEQVFTDPLVINLDSNPVSVDDQTFFFDIDCDGIKDNISTLSKGNGFLALDKNGDGIINDGSELFGTQSGDGFFDLAAYDEDSNGWIDEADYIFDKLKIWTKDSDGTDILLSLKDADIGAIYLGRTSTSYALNDLTNNTNAYIKSSGVFLRESGESGIISQIDLAKH